MKTSAYSGQQLAQVDNPDPFAPPVWRSPDLPHARLGDHDRPAGPGDRRHTQVPGPAPGARPGARRPGPRLEPGRMARPGHPHRHRDRAAHRLAVALAWVVLPVHRLPGPRQVAALALPAALAGRADHRPPGAGVPRPGPGAGARQGPLHPVHRPGARPARLRPGPRRLRRPGREPGPRVRRNPVPGPPGPARLPDPGVRPPRRAGRDHLRPGHPGARRT